MKKHLAKKIAGVMFFALAMDQAPADILSPEVGGTNAIAQIENLETQDGFSAQFWMTTEEQIFTTWSQTSAIRNLKPTLQVQRNTPVYLALFMANPGVRSVVKKRGAKPVFSSDITFDLYVINPSGIVSLASKQRVGWRGSPPSPGLVNLAKDRGVLNFEAIDPLGEYTVVLMVHDNIRKVDMKLTRKLKVED